MQQEWCLRLWLLVALLESSAQRHGRCLTRRCCLPAMEECLSESVAAAEASVAPIAIPTSAAARAAKSLMPSPQYMQLLPKPYMI